MTKIFNCPVCGTKNSFDADEAIEIVLARCTSCKTLEVLSKNKHSCLVYVEDVGSITLG